MSYKPDESTWMAYLYGELDEAEREKVERYLMESPEARAELESLADVRKMMGLVKDKEVIAPPIVIDKGRNGFDWNTPYIKIMLSLAASFILIMVVGKLTGVSVNYSNQSLTIRFGDEVVEQPGEHLAEQPHTPQLTSQEVQQMIDASMNQNNLAMQASWKETQQKLDASIRYNLATNSSKIDQLVREASTASQDQIRDYVASIQTQNIQLVKDYFQLSQTEQKQYMEDLLVDFAKYLQQQRNDDLMLMQTRLNSLEQHTDMFKQETEQILSSIISNTSVTAIKN